jgi:aspartate aminotransferase-like enzyme
MAVRQFFLGVALRIGKYRIDYAVCIASDKGLICPPGS